MHLTKSRRNNIIFLIVIVLLIIPQTRKPIQVFVHKGLALIISPAVMEKDEQYKLKSYNWKLEDHEAGVFHFEDTQGKVVLINFWATWCPPCIAEMPSLQKLYDDYGDKMEFVFVSNESPEVINDFLSTNAYTFKVYTSLSDYSGIFDVTSIPRTFLINKEGYIIVDKTGAANWNSPFMRDTIDTLLHLKSP